MSSGVAGDDRRGEGPSLLGSYRVTGVLGRGGMGVVYRGEHVETGTPAAIKTVRSARPDLVAGIRREIQTLASVSHEGVVDVLAYGVSDGLPWYAMELLVGQTLRDWMRPAVSHNSDDEPVADATLSQPRPAEPSKPSDVTSAPTRVNRRPRQRTGELLRIVRHVCRALAHLHAAGIVHRDLKPENVFVRSDGSPILVDLGIAARFGGDSGREALDAYVGPIGSLQYMSPEQIRGEFVDARSDLYALGCILYECVTGEPPFFGLPRSSVLSAHLEQRAPPVASLVDGVAPELDLLITRLLEKEPHARLGYAEDVARVLNGVCEDESPAAVVQPAVVAAPYVYRPPFVGRRVTLEILDEAVRELKDRASGQTIYIGGESGVGKTRLTMEATRMATQRGLPVIVGQCTRLAAVDDEQASGLPLHVFAPVLLAMADHCRECGPSETQRLFGTTGRVLVNYQPALADAPGFSTLPDAPPLEPGAARKRVLDAMRAALLAFADLRSFVFVADDLQWADELSIEVLARLPPLSASSRGLLTIATYRPEECGPKIRQLVNEPGVRRIDLDRFGLGEVSALVRGMLALEQSPMPLANALERKCNGNPFFIIEYLRSAIGQGLLRRDAGRWQLGPGRDLFDFLEESIAVPSGVGKLVEERLHDLDPAAQHLVQVGAVLGREFDADLLLSSAGMAASGSGDAMRNLRERHIFEDSDGGGLRFVHDVIRETAYRRIPAPRSQELHRLAATAIESQSASSERAFKSLGYHFAKARLHGRASSYYRRAAEYAASMFANDDAIACYRAALAEASAARGTQGAARGLAAVHEGLGDVLRIKGEQEGARESYGAALRGLRRGVQRARLHRKAGKTWETHHAHDDALEAYRRAATALGERSPERDEEWWQEFVQLSLDRMWVHYWLNRTSEMEALIEASRDSLMERGSRFQRARFLQLVVMLRIRRERYLVSQETVRLAQEAFDLGAGLAEAERAALHFVVFFALVLAGQVDAADVEGRTVLAWATRAGAVTLQARCLTYLIVVARRRNEVDRVKQLASECEAACSQSQLAEYTGALLANRAWAALREGRREEARELADSALTAWRAVRVPYPMQWLALFPLLALAVQASRVDEAVGVARALLEEQQQRLPDELTHMLHVSALGDAPLERLARATELAERLSYL